MTEHMLPEYAELHCHSSFSFLDGASHPEDLVRQAARLGLAALAITDHGGLYGAVRFASAARDVGMKAAYGAELTLEPAGARTGVPDPEGAHLVVIARDLTGYASLSRTISEARLAGSSKDQTACSLDALSDRHGGHWLVLTGCRKGLVPASLTGEGPRAARRSLSVLIEAFGRENIAVEIWDHGDPIDTPRNDELAALAVGEGVDLVATNNVHYATPSGHLLAGALAAARARRSLDELDPWLCPSPTASLRSAHEQERRFARWPGAVRRAAELGKGCAVDLYGLSPGLPHFSLPAGYSEQSLLVRLVEAGACERYGRRESERVKGAWDQIDHELSVIEALGYAGYFLIVWDIVEFCRKEDIYCQGRGSAANSAVCYALGITRADPVSLDLLFERFLSPERDGPPDIDIDIESGRRDEVIAYVYDRYGREHAAQVSNVITYRTRSARRDMAMALGSLAGDETCSRGKYPLEKLVAQAVGLPRHLGIHPGGMVICDRPVVEVCPVEWARRPGRSVLQWDKDDCAALGLVKFDLLGLGMLEALHRAVDLVAGAHGRQIDLARIPQEQAVYDMLCAADTVGVFQVESRAQMATLPRVRPRCFADLVVEVALIRPGPIQGGSVHPYIRRRQGLEAPEAPHPSLERSLRKTLGVPLFQEQMMHMAIDAAGFTPSEADQLRQAMSAKRSGERMARLHDRLLSGMQAKGIDAESAEQIVAKLQAFASFGFPESHAVSFAYLVYASAWLKLHYPAAFYAALLNSQPMGFWSPQSLLADARRHGVEVRPPDVQVSRAGATLESYRTAAGATLERDRTAGLAVEGPEPAIRLGLCTIRSIGTDMAERMAAHSPYSSMEDLVRRTGVGREGLEALALAGALDRLAPSRREDGTPAGAGGDHARKIIWAAGPICATTKEHLPGMITGIDAPPLPAPTAVEHLADDIWSMGLTLGPTAVELARADLDELGIVRASDLTSMDNGARVSVSGAITHRQQPPSARGTVFVNIEDETGMVNVIFSPGAWKRWYKVAAGSPVVVIRGRLELSGGAANVIAEKVSALELHHARRSPEGPVSPPARNFR